MSLPQPVASPVDAPLAGPVGIADPPSYGTWRAWQALIIMSLQMLLVGIDCSIVTLLVTPVEGALRVDDVGFATITFTAFSVGYSLVSYPAGLLADAFSRRDMIAIGSMVWAIAGAIAVHADSAPVFAFARAIAGVGTVLMGVAMLPLLYDAFPREQRALANGAYMSMTAVGAGIGWTLCGALVDATRRNGSVHALGIVIAPWQQCFVAVAVCGLLSGIIMMTVREPARRDLIEVERANPRESMRVFARYMHEHAFLWIALFLAFEMAAVAVNGANAWAPAFASRRFGGSAVSLMTVLGPMYSAGSLLGSIGGGVLAQLMINAGKSRRLPYLMVALTLLECVFFAVFPFAPSWPIGAACIGVGWAAYGAMVVLIFIAIQEAAPNGVRSQLFGIFCCLSFVPGVLGPTCVALVAEHLLVHAGGLGPAFTLVALATGGIGAALYLQCARPYGAAMRGFRPAPAAAD